MVVWVERSESHTHEAKELVTIRPFGEIGYYPQMSQIFTDSSTHRVDLRESA